MIGMLHGSFGCGLPRRSYPVGPTPSSICSFLLFGVEFSQLVGPSCSHALQRVHMQFGPFATRPSHRRTRGTDPGATKAKMVKNHFLPIYWGAKAPLGALAPSPSEVYKRGSLCPCFVTLSPFALHFLGQQLLFDYFSFRSISDHIFLVFFSCCLFNYEEIEYQQVMRGI